MIIRNGWIVENNQLIKKDIYIKDGYIQKVQEEILDLDEEIDARGCLVMPGAVDVHVHLREPGYSYKETIFTGTSAAAKGGITEILAMANLNPCPDSLKNLFIEQKLIEQNAVVHVHPYCALTKNEKGEELADLPQLCKHVYGISDDGVGVNQISLLEEAMQIALKENKIIASHAEDSVDSKLPKGEYIAVKREIEMAKRIGCRYHFCHLSTKESFDEIRKARKEGYTNITCEVTPHHLLLNEEMIKDGNWKMNPPLRSEENRLATVEALLDGTVSIIASDHAPHSEEEKSKVYEDCPNGIIGLETMLPLIYTYFIQTKKATFDDFLNWFIYNPIQIFGLPKRKLESGYVADLTILDISNFRKYKKEEILSLGKNTPFLNWELTGFAKYTIQNGKIIWRA
ncbi:MAG: dihydroorotase [Anaeroplasmataceae bacterium]|nr:dihydroorotase [Anaeroplasmataceae bacterium]